MFYIIRRHRLLCLPACHPSNEASIDGSLSHSPPELWPGEVWLVGAGPGDPGRASWLAATALIQADAVIHDRDIEAAILALAPAGRLVQPASPSGDRASAFE